MQELILNTFIEGSSYCLDRLCDISECANSNILHVALNLSKKAATHASKLKKTVKQFFKKKQIHTESDGIKCFNGKNLN